MAQAAKPVYLIGNWKSHKTLTEAEEFVANYSGTSDHVVAICPPLPFLPRMAELLKDKPLLKLGSQDVSQYPYGAYTGEVAIEMIKDFASFVIVGHSERRRYFNETNAAVAAKARQVIDAGLTPIVCVDEPYLESQLAYFEKNEFERMIIAYEPLSAIGSGKPDSPEEADAMAQKIIQLAAADVPVLYGGSVTAENIASFTACSNISGALVGGASLEVDSWTALVSKVS